MNVKEFKKTARRIETKNHLTFDVRPFDSRQGEAINSYLCGVITALQIGLFGSTKPVILVCAPGATLSDATDAWLKSARQRGVIVEIRRGSDPAETVSPSDPGRATNDELRSAPEESRKGLVPDCVV